MESFDEKVGGGVIFTTFLMQLFVALFIIISGRPGWDFESLGRDKPRKRARGKEGWGHRANRGSLGAR